MVIEDEMCSFGCSRSFLWYWSPQLLKQIGHYILWPPVDGLVAYG